MTFRHAKSKIILFLQMNHHTHSVAHPSDMQINHHAHSVAHPSDIQINYHAHSVAQPSSISSENHCIISYPEPAPITTGM